MLLITAPVMYGQRRRAVVQTFFPPCTVVEGTPGVTFTRDEGQTLAPIAQDLRGVAYTFGLTFLDIPHTMLSFHRSTLSISNDDGCHWRAIGDYTADFPPTITAAKGGRAYIWSDNRQFLLRYDERGVTSLKPPGVIIGLAADPNNGLHVRAGFDDGGIAESTDGGDTWRGLGFIPGTSGIRYRVTFDPSNIDHMVAGGAVDGAYASFDAAGTWTKARGSFSDRINAFNFAISPVDGNTVWMMALDLADEARHIFLSRDGGVTYEPVVADSADVALVNGPIMVAHPTKRDVMYFVFGTNFQGYGTDVFRYDAATDSLTKTHNSYHDVNAITFAPGRPDVMYFGLAVEQVF